MDKSPRGLDSASRLEGEKTRRTLSASGQAPRPEATPIEPEIIGREAAASAASRHAFQIHRYERPHYTRPSRRAFARAVSCELQPSSRRMARMWLRTVSSESCSS